MGRHVEHGRDCRRYDEWRETARLGQESWLANVGQVGGHCRRLRRSVERYSRDGKAGLCHEEWCDLSKGLGCAANVSSTRMTEVTEPLTLVSGTEVQLLNSCASA